MSKPLRAIDCQLPDRVRRRMHAAFLSAAGIVGHAARGLPR